METCVEPCQLCGVGNLQKFEIPNSSVLWVCRDCELYQYGEIVDEQAYAGDYHSGYEVHRRGKIRTARIRLNRIRSRLNLSSRPRVLDVGCSIGATLEAARQIGWDAVGVDVSQDAVDYCCQRDLSAQKVDGLRLPFPDNEFDVVVNWHVIEHVADVQATLAEWHRVIRPGGMLVMETPDAASPRVRKRGASYRKFWAPEHTYTFTYQNLKRFIERAGLTVERTPKLGSLFNFNPLLGGYAALYQSYHGLRRLLGIQKAFQIFARKKVMDSATPLLASANPCLDEKVA
ncbi:MAG: class I SAM-dependent methyltransferase [Pirellulaceae bacterium]|nr:class I SAM-dependent methyltransferase [Pirellulaceae bacterium]